MLPLPFEDLSVFFSDFAQPVLMGEEGVEILAIFDCPEIEFMDGGYSGISARQPTLLCRSSDVATVTEGTRFVVEGEEYYAKVPEPDGTGITEIQLMRAS